MSILRPNGVSLEEVIRAVDSGVKAIVVTHLFGQAIPEIEQIAEYCAKTNIPLLEDCAQAHGAESKEGALVHLVTWQVSVSIPQRILVHWAMVVQW